MSQSSNNKSSNNNEINTKISNVKNNNKNLQLTLLSHIGVTSYKVDAPKCSKDDLKIIREKAYFTYDKNNNNNKEKKEICENIMYSPQGTYLCLMFRTKVEMYKIITTMNDEDEEKKEEEVKEIQQGDVKEHLNELNNTNSSNNEKIWEVQLQDISEIQFSPQEKYFIVLSKFYKDDTGHENLNIYSTENGKKLKGYRYSPSINDQWPKIKFTPDDKVFGICFNKQLTLYSISPTGSGTKLSYTNLEEMNQVDSFQVVSSPPNSDNILVSIYSIDTKKKTSHIKLLDIKASKVISSVNLSQTDSAEMIWNPLHYSCCIVKSSVDVSGTSYYGKNKLYIMNPKKNIQKEIQLAKIGQIHDIQWNPKGNEFIAVYGQTPCKATIFNCDGKPTFELGTGPRNRICWNSFGRLFCWLGNGNYHGEMEFWDRQQLEKIGQGQAEEASFYEWSPCGRFFLTSTVTPILNTANKYQLFKYNGVLFSNNKFEKLYRALWRPVKYGDYPLRPPSPRGIEEGKKHETKLDEKVSTGKYVPPHLKNQALMTQQSPIAYMASSTEHYQRKDESAHRANKNHKPKAKQQQPAVVNYIPGLTIVPSQESKKKKSNKKKKPQQQNQNQ